MTTPSRFALLLAALAVAAGCHSTPAVTAPAADYHLHLFGPGVIALNPRQHLLAADAIAMLDSAGIQHGLILSDAYMFGNPNRPAVENEYAKVRAENDWTASQVALYPTRLRAFCSFNPLREYAIEELERCAADPNLRYGIKLHFGNSDVDVHNPDHVRRLRNVFAAANARGMAIAVHEHANVNLRRPYGHAEALVFLDSVLPFAPDVPIQIAHLAGAGSYDDDVDQALQVYIDAIRARDRRVRNVYFDASLGRRNVDATRAGLIAIRLRQLGLDRVLYGTDPVGGDVLAVRESWLSFRDLPLTAAEFRTIMRNEPPYMKF